MTKRMNPEEFQDFVVEQFKMMTDHLGKMTAQITGVQDDVAELREDQQSLRKAVTGVADGQRELRTEVVRLRGEISEVKEELRPIARAVDKDALKLVQHDRRIKILERRGSHA